MNLEDQPKRKAQRRFQYHTKGVFVKVNFDDPTGRKVRWSEGGRGEVQYHTRVVLIEANLDDQTSVNSSLEVCFNNNEKRNGCFSITRVIWGKLWRGDPKDNRKVQGKMPQTPYCGA